MKIKTRIKSTLLCLFVFLSSLVGILVCLIFQNAFSAQAAQECGIVSKYLRIGTDITMQYVVAVPEGAQNVKMTFTLNGKTTEVSDYTQGDGVRTYSYGGVTPQYLGANVAAALYYDGEKQDENVSSVKDYLTQLIASSASDLGIGERQAVSMQTLAKDVLFYGAAAQVYTQTDTNAPVNAGVAAGTVWEDVSDRLSSAPAIAATGDKLFKNANVSFGNHLVPFATFTLPEGTELSEVSATVAGRKVEPVLVDEETRLYKISYGGFSILDIDGSFDYVLTVGDKMGTLTFSVAKYIETMAEKSTNAEFVDFIKATYVYAQSAKEYKTLTETPAFTATIAGSGVTFADGSTSAQFVVGAELPVTVEEGLTFLGWRGEDGLIVSSEAFRMPKKDVTLVPAFNTDTYVTQGFGKLQFAYGKDGKDNIVNYGAEASLYGYGYIGGELARVLSITGKADATSGEGTGTNASFRTQTWYNRERGTTYRFVLTLHNFGSEEVSFRVYLRSSGSDTSDVTYYDVTLAAGETQTVTIDWTSSAAGNKNLLTYFKLTSDATGALIGGYMYAEDPAARHITLADGLEYKGETALTLSVGKVLSVSEITVPEGKTLIGFKDNYDNYYADSYTVGTDDVTLYPVWAVETVTQGDGKLDFGVFLKNNAPAITTNSYRYNVDSANTTTIIEGEKARVFAVTRKNTPVHADGTGLDSSFRVSTNYAPMDNSRIHTLVYTIGNLGASDFAVQIYLRKSGSDTVEKHPLYSTTVVVPAGKTATVALRTKMYNAVASSGSEMLNYFKFVEQDGVTLPDSARLAVSVYGYTAAYGFASVEEGTFEDGSTTLLCKEGEPLPRVLTKSGAATSHVAVGGVPYANGAAVMPADDVSVTAVDYAAVTSGSGALDWNAGSVKNSFGNSAASVKGAAAYRNGMVGTMLTVKPNAGKTPTNFRTMTAYSSAKGTKYTFTYTFVNCGAEEITFTCWQVNNGNDTADMATSGKITLGVGETRTVTLETKRIGNNNAMCYYAWNSAADSAQMQLFVSTSVVKG